ncbi:Endo-1,4-beta-xylanase A [Neolewinella maritima]|uniref:Beta-xylanase n=1 Tax=Neolewinella maritima TaxID=1383882 RepID=A0ABM9AXW5_9BACT|nr:endo-1,4-beta-xylanase [Neolewinella maritima]CAH0999550.1 Endo-1,4-beta-xylanase A [Neolewinella maritima]
MRKYIAMHYLVSLLILLLVGCADRDASPQASAATAEPAGLKDAASFPIGGAINIRRVNEDAKLRAITTTEFNSITSTNDMKMYRIAAREGQLDFARADSTVAFAEAQGMRMFGHALVWHYGLPDHIAGLQGAAMADFLTAYIDTVVNHFRGRIDGWDVVNEVLDTKGGGMRRSPFYQQLGTDYIGLAFRTARRADPDAKLFINDFGTERDTAKVTGLLALVDSLRGAGVPIDGIGLQWHQQMGDDTAVVRSTLRRAAATGLLIHVSELDLIFNTHNDEAGGGTEHVQAVTPAMLEQQAERYEALARIYRQEVPAPQQYGITFWDFTDRDTWIKGFFDMGDWPTVYDENLERKPAYFGFRRGLQ